MKVSFTDQNFEEEVVRKSATLPVLVDFRADWCGPCKLLDPLIEEVASEYQGKVVVGSVDVDNNPQVAASFNILSIPTVVIIKKGQIVKQLVGYQGKEKLVSELNTVIS